MTPSHSKRITPISTLILPRSPYPWLLGGGGGWDCAACTEKHASAEAISCANRCISNDEKHRRLEEGKSLLEKGAEDSRELSDIGKASNEEEALRLKRERLKADLVEVEKQMSSGQAQDPSHDD